MQRFKRERDSPTGRLAWFWCEKIMFNECCCIEPTLDELLGDAAVRLLMRRDGVTETDIRLLLSELKDARLVASDRAKRGHGKIPIRFI